MRSQVTTGNATACAPLNFNSHAGGPVRIAPLTFMKRKFSISVVALMFLIVGSINARANNLDTNSTSISLANDEIATMASRAGQNQPLIKVGDEFWVLVKMTPGPGTKTGVG